MSKIILYSTHCPLCKGLEKNLKNKNITYALCTDKQIMAQKGITRVPVLEIDGQLLMAPQAMKWTLAQE